ncbi:MAG: SpoIIE family protein phosphatase [Crocinitomicaceae bacterium]
MKDVKDFLNSLKTDKQTLHDLHGELKYAGIMQRGMFPKKRHFDRIFDDNFLIYLPKSQISGDFYWVAEKNEYKYIAAADCTGHGIPAAMLSVLGYSLLNYALFSADLNSTAEILRKMDQKFIEAFDFSDEKEGAHSNDWIDISICRINRLNHTITYSGANRKLFAISNDNRSYILNGSRYPIGGWQLEDYREFSATEIQLAEGDWIYIGSDGYQDQFGGPKASVGGKKFGSRQLHQILKTNFKLKGEEQKKILLDKYVKWIGSMEQTDDICLLGVKI